VFKEVGEIRTTYGRREMFCYILVENPESSSLLEGPVIDGRIILQGDVK
jgi:hypothetical protein